MGASLTWSHAGPATSDQCWHVSREAPLAAAQAEKLVAGGGVQIIAKPDDARLGCYALCMKLDSRSEALMRYVIVIEKAENNYSAYVPDLPGCVATGATVEETEAEIREAIEFHLQGMREDGLPIPEPASKVEYI